MTRQAGQLSGALVVDMGPACHTDRAALRHPCPGDDARLPGPGCLLLVPRLTLENPCPTKLVATSDRKFRCPRTPCSIRRCRVCVPQRPQTWAGERNFHAWEVRHPADQEGVSLQ